MPDPQKPRLDQRMVFALVLIAIPFMLLAARVILFRPDDGCGDPDHSQVGGIEQLFVPGTACPETPQGR
jgi:hypothetical protein